MRDIVELPPEDGWELAQPARPIVDAACTAVSLNIGGVTHGCEMVGFPTPVPPGPITIAFRRDTIDGVTKYVAEYRPS